MQTGLYVVLCNIWKNLYTWDDNINCVFIVVSFNIKKKLINYSIFGYLIYKLVYQL